MERTFTLIRVRSGRCIGLELRLLTSCALTKGVLEPHTPDSLSETDYEPVMTVADLHSALQKLQKDREDVEARRNDNHRRLDGLIKRIGDLSDLLDEPFDWRGAAREQHPLPPRPSD
jgi:hypothetical protein